MRSGMMNTIFSAVVGGIVGAMVAVVVCGALKQDVPESFEKLKVGELIVSDKMMLWEDGKEDADLLIQNGGLLAKTRVIATQLCGNAVLANCVLTTPDHPTSPLDQCEIFTEMASSRNEGGMLTVRSPDGGNILSNQSGVQSGWAYTITYDNQANPICFFRRNDSGLRALGRFDIPQPPVNPENGANPNAQQGGADQQLEVSQNMPTGSPMNHMQSVSPQHSQNPGIEHNAMAPTMTPR